MAAARDQAARILRPEPDPAEDESAARRCRGSRRSASCPSRRRDRRTPPARRRRTEPGRRQAGRRACRDCDTAAPKSGKRKRVLMGVGALLALAAAAYGVHYFLVGRFLVSTDDAYVRANNTTLGARVSGHIAAILAGDNARGACRRRDLQDRRRRLSYRGGRRAHQDRDPAGHHRPHRPSGRRAGKRGRAGQGAAGVRRSRPRSAPGSISIASRR